ncbi:C-type mannose receptor 2-like [Ptychodera flava]|uniref:C-type mannose receptor 2-like n=1 Tax=Ptychodera flava TaxID=63121 RepID=UPI00396A3B53
MIWFSAITLVFLCGPQLGVAQPVAYSDKLCYDDALAACEAKGMMLAKDISESKHDLIKEEIKAKGLDEMDFWINGKVNSDGDWVSSDGDHSTSYRPWAIFEPNGSGSCLQLRRGSGYAWDDDKCFVAKGYVCEPIEDESDRPIAFAEKLSFDEALASCTSKGMVLASDTSSVKHTLLVDELKSKGMDGEDFWINGKLDNNGDWMTSDGHHLTSYQPWAIFEPNGSGSCLTLWAHLGYAWDDTGCDVEKYYICEPAVLPEDMPVAFSDRLSHAGAEASCKTKGMILAKDISDTKHALLVGVLLKSGLKSQDAWITGSLHLIMFGKPTTASHWIVSNHGQQVNRVEMVDAYNFGPEENTNGMTTNASLPRPTSVKRKDIQTSSLSTVYLVDSSKTWSICKESNTILCCNSHSEQVS